MAGISATGLGSGLDIQSLVSQLVAAERAPLQGRLDSRQGKLQTQLSGYGVVKSALSNFQKQVSGLTDITLFGKMKATSGDDEAVGISADKGAQAGSYQLEVNALAKAQSLASAAFENTKSVVGGGTLTFRFGAVSVDGDGKVSAFAENEDRGAKSIEIAAGSTLTQVRDAVNDANIGVQASIINDGSGQRLVFSAKDSGAANGFVIETADSDGDNTDAEGLSKLAFAVGASHAQLTRAGADAEFSVNGLAVTRASNKVSDVIEGVTLDLKATTSSAVDLNVSRDDSAVKDRIKAFVDGYNALQNQLNQLTRYDPATQSAAALTGNAMVRNITSSLRSLMTAPVAALEGNQVRALADLGIVTKADGTLELNDAKLSKALEERFDQVGALFASGGLVDQATDIEFVSATEATIAGKYKVVINQLAEQGRLTGVSAPAAFPFTVTSASDNITVKIDGVRSGEISLSRRSYSSHEDLAAELQTRINEDKRLADKGVSVSVSYDADSGRFQISSALYGSKSTVEIVKADADLLTGLGMAVGTGSAGVDVAGTIDGRAAQGEGQTLTGRGGAVDGLALRIGGEDTGERGSVTYARGILGGLSKLLDSYLDSGEGVLTNATKNLSAQLEDVQDDRAALARRMESVYDRYLKQFTALDGLIAQLNQTSTFLAQQLTSLPTLNKKG